MMVKRTEEKEGKQEPTIAPGMEMDELDEEATPEEIRNNDYTEVTQLYRDWI
jgi:hypothetical protein